MVRKQEAERLKRSWSRGIAITIVRFGLNVRATLSTTVNSIKTRRKKPVKKAEKEADDLKRGVSLVNYKLKFEETGNGVLKLRNKKGKK